MAPVTSLREAALVSAALVYAGRGWSVFPCFEIGENGNCACTDGPDCGSPGKHPRAPRGFLSATTDTAKIKKWWKRWPRANVGIASGMSGLLVVDVDPRNDGDNSMRELEQQHGKLPDTVRALTGGGGTHDLFIMPDAIRSGKLGLGVDIKAEGGYILAAPSNHMSGTNYQWDCGADPADVEVAPCPKWVIDKLHRKDATEYETGGAVADGFLGAAFEAVGWLGRKIDADKSTAECPWEDEHTGGKRHDSSTVIFAPRKGKNTGHWFCSHGHCQGRTLKDVLAVLPESAKAAARKKLGMPEEYVPPANEPEEIDKTEPWALSLRFNQEGRLTKDAGNAAILLANVPEWKGCLAYDAFADRISWTRPVPGVPGMRGPVPGDDLQDHHATYVGHWFAKFRNVGFSKNMVQDALESAARENEIHPVRDYLDSLTWDGVPRVGAWLRDYLGAADDDYTSAVGRFWLISAIARIYQPGAQCDHILVLEGGQGSGKSTAVRTLAGDWYLPNLPDIQSKDAAQVLQGNWIAEIGELDALKGAAGTRIKDFISRNVDTYRPSYGRFTVRRPRTVVFCGTTNESQYLTDATGARRFWPVKTVELKREALIADRSQIWAEAKSLYDAGDDWWPSEDLVAVFSEKQDQRFTEDDWIIPIQEWAEGRTDFTNADVLEFALKLEPGRWDRAAQTRAGNCLRKLSFQSVRISQGENRIRVYRLTGLGDAQPIDQPGQPD